MPSLLLLIPITLVAYTFEAVFGLAGTVLLLTVFGLFSDGETMKLLVIYSLLPQAIGQTIGLVRVPTKINFKALGQFFISATIGALLGLYLFESLDSKIFFYLLAGVITFSGLSMIYKPGKFKLNIIHKLIFDFLAGVGGILFGISGPLVVTRFLSTFKNKTAIRNHTFVVFLAFNAIRLVRYLTKDPISITPEIWKAMYISAPLLIIVLWFANYLHLKVNEKVFRTVIAWVVLIGGVMLFFK